MKGIKGSRDQGVKGYRDTRNKVARNFKGPFPLPLDSLIPRSLLLCEAAGFLDKVGRVALQLDQLYCIAGTARAISEDVIEIVPVSIDLFAEVKHAAAVVKQRLKFDIVRGDQHHVFTGEVSQGRGADCYPLNGIGAAIDFVNEEQKTIFRAFEEFTDLLNFPRIIALAVDHHLISFYG